jgi:hypothetical protein
MSAAQSPGVRYTSAVALRAALRARLSATAKAGGGHGLDELQRQFAYDRLLARAFDGPDSQRWVLKGAGALLARLPQARHSRDLDLAYLAVNDERGDEDLDEAAHSLREAADRDLGDHFRFEVVRVSPLQEAAKGRRLHLVAYLGARYAAFHVDVVVGTAMTGVPELAPPLTSVDIPGLIRPAYRLFPLVDHIADKLCAIIEVHDQDGVPRPSTRIKDLVDLALIASTQCPESGALRRAVAGGCAHRGLPMPQRFAVPDVEVWRVGYPGKAREAAGLVPDFVEAVRLVCALLDPVLAGTAAGVWDPTLASWGVSRISA